MLAHLFIPLAVLAAAAILGVWELRAWRRARRSERAAGERDFRWRRFRRRMQADAMLAVIGVLMLIGSLIEPTAYPWLFIGLWAAVFVFVLWLMLLALADALVSLHRGQQLRQELLSEKIKLEAEARPDRPPPGSAT